MTVILDNSELYSDKVIITEGADLPFNNFDALSKLPWCYRNEVILSDSLIEFIYTAPFKNPLKGNLSREFINVLDYILLILPDLPWDRISMFRADWDWPRAMSVPGAIIVSSKIDTSTSTWSMLYLVHETVHQWIGGLIAPPKDQQDVEWMEAWVDSVTILAVTQQYPSTKQAFSNLFKRYSVFSGTKNHALKVLRILDRFKSLQDVQPLLVDGAKKMRIGERTVFAASHWSV